MNKENKGGVKVSFKSMIIAMIVALLGFLGFGGLELGNSDGADAEAGNKAGIVSEVNESKTNEDVDTDVEIEEAMDSNFYIYVHEEQILIKYKESDVDLDEVQLNNLEQILTDFPIDVQVYIYDDGAISKTYVKVMEIVNKSGLENYEYEVSN